VQSDMAASLWRDFSVMFVYLVIYDMYSLFSCIVLGHKSDDDESIMIR